MNDDTMHAIRTLAGSLRDLQQRAERRYRPVVDDILRTRSRDTHHIEQTLDGLLDFCSHEHILAMYKQLCRHYWNIDPAATAHYINAYRDYWDNDAPAMIVGNLVIEKEAEGLLDDLLKRSK